MITIAALFTKNSGEPATGLTLSDIDLYLYRRKKSDGAISTVWTAVHATEEIGGGLYSRAYTSEDTSTYEYYAYGHYTGATALDTDYALQSCPWFSEAAVWGYTTRTLTQSAAAVQAAVEGDMISIMRGDTLSASLTGLGSLAGYVSLDWTVKDHLTDTDAEAVIRIRKNASGLDDGLLRLNGAAGTAANGAITIDDAALGNITITMEAEETAKLIARAGLTYDVQIITATTVDTLTSGPLEITADVTLAVT